MAAYLSDTFFHFVGRRDPLDHAANYDKLAAILNSRCVRVPPDMPGSSIRRDLAQTLLSGELIKPSMTCFAEIREEHLAIHISKYGYFGVGLPSHFLIDHSARPVIYVPLRSDDWRRPDGITALQDIEQIYRGFLEHVVEPRRVPTSMRRTMGTRPSTEDEAVHLMASTFERQFLVYLKPFNSELPHDHRDNYYAEREWRCDIDVNFALSDVRAVIVHPDFAGRCAADFSKLSDRLRP